MENHAGASSCRRHHHAHELGFDIKGWLTLGTGAQEKQTAKQSLACLPCSETFLTSQALVEHQYSHQRARDTVRRDYPAPAKTFHQAHPPSTMFPPNHRRVLPTTRLELGLGHSAGSVGMNIVPPNDTVRKEYPAFVDALHQAPPYSTMFQPNHGPVSPTVRLELGLGHSAGSAGMNIVPPNIYPHHLDRRFGHMNRKDLLGRMDMVGTEGGTDDLTELTMMCTEPRNMHGHEYGGGFQNVDSGTKVSSKELDLTLRL